MSTLFQRVIGDISENEVRIPIHGIRALFGELERGAVDPAYIIAAYDLDAGQQADLLTLITKMIAATDKGAFSRFIFDWLVLAERKFTDYRVEADFWLRVDAEAV